ncbi:TolB family protein [Flavobacterium haoranii]|uniref:TolB family protein n=2 Tax=Flavobacterium haoranii TaxID=683124 RepID=UPI000AB4408F|nr:PD40 domain-containing protein [Flavobacterium haoranii]
MQILKSKTIILVTSLFFFISNAQETNIKNLKQLTFGGDNAEAYFSPNGKSLTLQITNPQFGIECDQIYKLDLNKDSHSPEDLQLISTGLGRTTCSFFMPDGKHILYASTHEGGHACPAPPKSTDGKYLWAVYPEFDIYVADLNGKVVKQLTNSPGYDAEAVVSPDGKKIVFTSTRSGDLELWIMDIDGSNLKQLTDRLGYDGGAFFSHDSKKLVFRSSRPKTAEAIAEYKDLLSKNLVAPTEMEIYTINIDGTNLKQVTHLGKANWAPYFHPSDKKIIFSSNHHSTRGYDFQLFMIDEDGKNLRQITWESEFNAFPMFSPDGKKLVFSSNRQQSKPRETNVFIADWVETDEKEVINDANLKGHIKYLASDELEGRLTG